MKKKPIKREIAAALGISAPAFNRYIKRGCPIFSIEAAREWQAQHIDPTQRLMHGRASAVPPASADVDARLARVSAIAVLAAENFEEHHARLRAALRAVPLSARAAVRIPMSLWHQLLPAGLDEAVPPDPEGVASQSAADRAYAAAAAYGLCCGELQLAP